MCDDDLLYDDRIVHPPPKIAYTLHCLRWFSVAKDGLPKHDGVFLCWRNRGYGLPYIVVLFLDGEWLIPRDDITLWAELSGDPIR